MNSMETYQKRLRDEIAKVEEEVQSHNQQIEKLNKRLEGLKRAVQLVESEEPAIAELLQTNLRDGIGVRAEVVSEPIAARQRGSSSRKQGFSRKQSASSRRNGRSKMTTARAAHQANEKNGLKRVDMIAAMLERRSALSVRDLIAALDREYGWKTTESSVTAHLYTNPRRFVHTKADRAAKRPVTWSLK